MRQVPVFMSWLVNAFENSSQYSEYYLDMNSGDVKFFSPMDFPEHVDIINRLDKQTERFAKLPKLEKDFSRKIQGDFIKTVKDPNMKKILETAQAADSKFRNILMDHRDTRMQWYQFENEKYAEFLKDWFKEKGIELLEKPPADKQVKKPDQ